jgi:hypothetical protein
MLTVPLAALALATGGPAAGLNAPEVKLVGVQGGSLVFEVTNPNDAPLPYYGYTAESFSPPLPEGAIAPLYRVELRTDGWKAVAMGWCGTGRGPVAIAPKKTVTFRVPVPGGDWAEAKVGLAWFPADRAEGSCTAWAHFTRKDVQEKR